MALDMDRIAWAAPIAGVFVGLIGALVLGATSLLGLPPLLSAGLATTALVAATGALHEDGLADVADGFGGGMTRERKLEIMRDSRVGAYGAIAIALALILRVGALTAALDGGFWRAGLSLMLAAALSRASALTPLALLPPARADGAGAAAGRLDSNALAAAWGSAVVIAVALGLVALGIAHALFAALMSGAGDLACCGAGASRDRRADWRRSGRCATIRRDRRLVRTSHRTWGSLSKARAHRLDPLRQRLRDRSDVRLVHRLWTDGRRDRRLDDNERDRADRRHGRACAALDGSAVAFGARRAGQRAPSAALMRFLLPLQVLAVALATLCFR